MDQLQGNAHVLHPIREEGRPRSAPLQMMMFERLSHRALMNSSTSMMAFKIFVNPLIQSCGDRLGPVPLGIAHYGLDIVVGGPNLFGVGLEFPELFDRLVPPRGG